MRAKRIHAPLRVVSYHSAMWHVWGMHVHAYGGTETSAPCVGEPRTECIFFEQIHRANRKREARARWIGEFLRNRDYYSRKICTVHANRSHDRQGGGAEIKRGTFNTPSAHQFHNCMRSGDIHKSRHLLLRFSRGKGCACSSVQATVAERSYSPGKSGYTGKLDRDVGYVTNWWAENQMGFMVLRSPDRPTWRATFAIAWNGGGKHIGIFT